MDQREEITFKAGRITRLQAQKKKAERVSIYLDGVFAFGVHQDLVLSYGLQKGRVLEVEEQERLFREDQVYRAKQQALSYLSYRARSTFEMRRKLQRAGYGEDVIEPVLERLRELNYLDDEAYARAYARGRFETGGYGPQRIRNDLMRRGVGRGLIDRVVADVFEASDEVLETARAQARKRWRRLAREEDPLRRRKKLSDFLLRRGFTYETIRRVVDELEQA